MRWVRVSSLSESSAGVVRGGSSGDLHYRVMGWVSVSSLSEPSAGAVGLEAQVSEIERKKTKSQENSLRLFLERVDFSHPSQEAAISSVDFQSGELAEPSHSLLSHRNSRLGSTSRPGSSNGFI
ncbi:hypothetical protein RRG08_031251 [Elysia crispata]|uniref:Uncharacterized protein n=1 Tax=Elysia crispata TaxID=231223 RepID=A0AAE1E022_9GAST|nr:hypothetical protein RRG08_031251 [Elysia crispata]